MGVTYGLQSKCKSLSVVFGVSPRIYRLVLLMVDPDIIIMSDEDLSGVALPFPLVTEFEAELVNELDPLAEIDVVAAILLAMLFPGETTEVDPLVDAC